MSRKNHNSFRSVVLFIALLLSTSSAFSLKPVEQKFPSTFLPTGKSLSSAGDGFCVRYGEMPDDPTKSKFIFHDELNPPGYLHDRINEFLDVIRTGSDFSHLQLFDFSNNYSAIEARAGDYQTTCGSPLNRGCKFAPISTAGKDYFVNRYRGFLNVLPAWMNKPVYVGVRTDDAAYLRIFDKTGTLPLSQLAFTGGPNVSKLGRRIFNRVVFANPGLYPIEIGFVQLYEDAVLEVVITSEQAFPQGWVFPSEEVFKSGQLDGAAENNLSNWTAFQLIKPEQIFQSVSGKHAFPTPEQCAQCPRGDIGTAGATSACGAGKYCNEAAVCDTCATNDHCGPDCQKCGGTTPVCNGSSCVECTQDADCSTGNTCVNNQCRPCTTDNTCAGNSCNCCPGGTQCMASTTKGQYICGSCTKDADCESGKRCDLSIMQCVADAGSCAFDPASPVEKCGPSCNACPTERPLCLGNVVCVQCRSDLDCSSGNYCLSGECVPCTTDKRCGPRCGSCTQDKPMCFSDGKLSANAQCVECLDNSQCGPGAVCDQMTHTCSQACTQCATTPDGNVCSQERCVQCVSSAQCPCGSTCNVKTGQCSPGCANVEDCLGSQCCSRTDNKCVPGRCKPGHAAGGLCGCDASMGGSCGCTASPVVASNILLHAPPPQHAEGGVPWIVWLVAGLALVAAVVTARFLQKPAQPHVE